AGSVTGGSMRLGISQPATSKQIRLLEADLGIPLFIRSGNRVKPTIEAQSLHEQVKRTYQGIQHLTRFAAGLRHHSVGEIAVAAMPMMARSWLPGIIGPFLQRHPGLSMALPVRSSRWIGEAVSAGMVDIGIALAIPE